MIRKEAVQNRSSWERGDSHESIKIQTGFSTDQQLITLHHVQNSKAHNQERKSNRAGNIICKMDNIVRNSEYIIKKMITITGHILDTGWHNNAPYEAKIFI